MTTKVEMIKKYEDEGYTGTDVSLNMSLFEYGVIWKRDIEGDNDWKFIYGIKVNDHNEYYKFDFGWIAKLDDLDWTDFKDVASYVGLSVEKWKALELPQQVMDCFSYYGYEDVFGSSYSGGFEIKEEG